MGKNTGIITDQKSRPTVLTVSVSAGYRYRGVNSALTAQLTGIAMEADCSVGWLRVPRWCSASLGKNTGIITDRKSRPTVLTVSDRQAIGTAV